MSEQIGMPAHLRAAIENGLCEEVDALFAKRQSPTRERRLEEVGDRLALDLQCLLMDLKETAVQSKWFDSAHEAIDMWHAIVGEPVDRKLHELELMKRSSNVV